MNTQERFAENLRRLRKNQKPEMTQEALAKVSGISITTLQNYERCAGNPTLANIEAIANALHVSIGELLGEDEQTSVRIQTYADLFDVLTQLQNLCLESGYYVNGESMDVTGKVSIECIKEESDSELIDYKEESDTDLMDYFVDYITCIRIEDKYLYDFMSSYQKANALVGCATDIEEIAMLQEMRDAWKKRQIEKNRDRQIYIPF